MEETLRKDYYGYRVKCTVCRRVKAPQGRSVPQAIYATYCEADCSGFHLDPKPSSLWPYESEADFGYRVAR